MNRRGFLQGISALVGGVLLEKAVPLGRVWSFPKDIKCLNVEQPFRVAAFADIYYDRMTLDRLMQNFKFVPAASKIYWDGAKVKRYHINQSEFYKNTLLA